MMKDVVLQHETLHPSSSLLPRISTSLFKNLISIRPRTPKKYGVGTSGITLWKECIKKRGCGYTTPSTPLQTRIIQSVNNTSPQFPRKSADPHDLSTAVVRGKHARKIYVNIQSLSMMLYRASGIQTSSHVVRETCDCTSPRRWKSQQQLITSFIAIQHSFASTEVYRYMLYLVPPRMRRSAHRSAMCGERPGLQG